MEVKELRCGNYVRHNKDWCYRDNDDEIEFQFTTMDFYAIEQCTMFSENISPIPLTEEWLEKFGFNWVEEAGGWADENHIIYGVKYDCWEFHPFCTNDKDVHLIIRNVHQLQNLIYCLTNQELKLI